MLASAPDLPILGVPLQWWCTLPLVVLVLYGVFRWRRFGEDDYTWNHQYFKLAGAFGLALCAVAAASLNLLTGLLQHAALWAVVLLAIALVLRFSRQQDWTNTLVLSAAIVGTGLLSLPLAGTIKAALYHPVRWQGHDPLAGVPRSTFAPSFPAPWREQPGQGSPHTYTRGEPGSGLLMVSLEPPSDLPHPTTADAAADLAAALDAVARDLPLGPRLASGHADAAAGPLAYADYRSDTHGPLRFWMLLSEVRVFASYTDGKSPAAEREIAEAQTILQAARFEHSPAAR